jgi:large subunit ribosomal protein L3
MAGRMGGSSVTVKNLKILKVDSTNNLIIIKGAIPGAINGVVYIKK